MDIINFPMNGFASRTASPMGYDELLQENLKLKDEKKRLETALVNKEVKTAELYINFGLQADEWVKTVKQILDHKKETLEAMEKLKQDVEESQTKMEKEIEKIQKDNKNLQEKQEKNKKSITGMKREIEELQKENKELKVEVEKLEEALIEHDDDQRERRLIGVHLGEIAYEIERLAGNAILAAFTREEDKQLLMYNLKLKNVKKRVSNLQNEEVKKKATDRIKELPSIIFEQWFIHLVEEIKADCRGIIRLPLESYEETISLVKSNCKEDKEKCAHILIMVKSLKELYDHAGVSFGEKYDGLPKKSSRTSKRIIAQEACEKQSKRQKRV